jgi:hypothetical protein
MIKLLLTLCAGFSVTMPHVGPCGRIPLAHCRLKVATEVLYEVNIKLSRSLPRPKGGSDEARAWDAYLGRYVPVPSLASEMARRGRRDRGSAFPKLTAHPSCLDAGPQPSPRHLHIGTLLYLHVRRIFNGTARGGVDGVLTVTIISRIHRALLPVFVSASILAPNTMDKETPRQSGYAFAFSTSAGPG